VTTSTRTEVARRKQQSKVAERTTFEEDFDSELGALVVRVTSLRWPNTRYQHDPVAFFREILGVEPWAEQIKIIEAVRDHSRVAVCSGHKTGKSTSIAGLALWFYCSFVDARAIMSSTTARQVDQILWRELRMIRARSGRCVACKLADPDGLIIPRPCPHSALIDGEQGELARTGLKADDFREIGGFTAREAEAVAGISGRNLLFLFDEASGIPDAIFEATEGNRAGGARILLAGNGTKNEGEFFEAFNSKAHIYKTLRISSESTPNVVQGRDVIPGLATREWITEKKLEWGEDSPLYKVRVKGLHATHEIGKIFSLHVIGEAEQRWADAPEAGRLFIGLDPAGESGFGDESAFSIRRGFKQLALRTMRGLNAEQHLSQLLLLIAAFKLPRERPVVVFDRDGAIGAELYGTLHAYVDNDAPAFDLVAVRSSDKAKRQPKDYDRMRDLLAGNLEVWMRNGGAIVEDVKLEKDLHALDWRLAVDGKAKLTPKDTLRKMLGRSPDRYDALALSVWEPPNLDDVDDDVPPSLQRVRSSEDAYAEPIMDPYAGASTWKR
jgi:phage terminase large subunit